jgi:hypothetical protein
MSYKSFIINDIILHTTYIILFTLAPFICSRTTVQSTLVPFICCSNTTVQSMNGNGTAA